MRISGHGFPAGGVWGDPTGGLLGHRQPVELGGGHPLPCRFSVYPGLGLVIGTLMRKGQPRRIRGVNLFVGDLNLAVEYYERRMGLVLDGRFGREAFLCWRSGGEDFLGLFQGRNRGWHHVEVRLLATDLTEALDDLESRGLMPFVQSAGSSTSLSALRARMPRSISVFTPLSRSPLIAEVADPEGRMIELWYLEEDYSDMEIPGLVAIEISSARQEQVIGFYERIGFRRTGAALEAASGQRLVVHKGTDRQWIRIVATVSDKVYESLAHSMPASADRSFLLRDPDGYEWIVLPGVSRP